MGTNKKQKTLFLLQKLQDLPVSKLKQSGRWLTTHLYYATRHLEDKEKLIFKVFKISVIMLFMVKKSQTFRNKISSMLGSLPKNKWTTFLDNLNSSDDLNILTIQLFQILLQESILRERVCQPFWTPAFKEISEMLWLPTGIDFVDSGSNSLNISSTKQVVQSQSLTIQTTRHVNRNLQKTYCPLFTSSLADKWANEAMPVVKLRTVKIKIHPTKEQKKILNGFIDTSRYIYNKTLEYIKAGHKPYHEALRDLLVTDRTKKGYDDYKAFDITIKEFKDQKKVLGDTEEDKKAKERLEAKIKEVNAQRRNLMKGYDYVKNPNIKDFETKTPKDIRDCAVQRCCDAYTSGFSNLKKGNIKFFNIKFKKKKEVYQSITLTPKLISIKNGTIRICPDTFKNDCVFNVGKKQRKDLISLSINHEVDLVRSIHGYHLHVPIAVQPLQCNQFETVASVDLGIRTFGTVHSHTNNETKIVEYQHRDDLLKKLNDKLKVMKGRIRKKQYTKIEQRKKHLVDRLHWDFINHLLSENDVIYWGDIKSHDIVKGGKNRTLNQAFNDLKFYTLKQRLFYKAYVLGKKIFVVAEHYTTKTCSCCGVINDNVGSKKVFECSCCGLVTGRDMNACKNIKLKGIVA